MDASTVSQSSRDIMWPAGCDTVIRIICRRQKYTCSGKYFLFPPRDDTSATSYNTARVAQSVEHWSNKPTVAGSIPVVSIDEKIFIRRHTEVINAGGLAQSEERNVSNVEAPGSKPGISSGEIIFLSYVTITPL